MFARDGPAPPGIGRHPAPPNARTGEPWRVRRGGRSYGGRAVAAGLWKKMRLERSRGLPGGEEPFRQRLRRRGHLPDTSRQAPVAQLDRAPDYESGGQRFESFRARHLLPKTRKICGRFVHRGRRPIGGRCKSTLASRCLRMLSFTPPEVVSMSPRGCRRARATRRLDSATASTCRGFASPAASRRRAPARLHRSSTGSTAIHPRLGTRGKTDCFGRNCGRAARQLLGDHIEHHSDSPTGVQLAVRDEPDRDRNSRHTG